MIQTYFERKKIMGQYLGNTVDYSLSQREPLRVELEGELVHTLYDVAGCGKGFGARGKGLFINDIIRQKKGSQKSDFCLILYDKGGRGGSAKSERKNDSTCEDLFGNDEEEPVYRITG